MLNTLLKRWMVMPEIRAAAVIDFVCSFLCLYMGLSFIACVYNRSCVNMRGSQISFQPGRIMGCVSLWNYWNLLGVFSGMCGFCILWFSAEICSYLVYVNALRQWLIQQESLHLQHLQSVVAQQAFMGFQAWAKHGYYLLSCHLWCNCNDLIVSK